MSNSQIKKGALISYVGIIFNIIAGLLYTPWMVKEIGMSDYGLYALAISFLTYFVMDFGLSDAIARFVAKYRVENNQQKINQILGLASKIYIYIDLFILIVLVVVFFFIQNIFTQLNNVEIEKFKVIYIIIGLFSLISFPFSSLDGLLIAYERFAFLKFCNLLNKVLTILLMVAALLMGYKLYALVFINAIVAIAIICAKLFFLRKNTKTNVDFKFKSWDLAKEIFGFSAWATVIGVAQRFLINFAPTLLAIYAGTTAIAIFSIGRIMEGYVWTFADALNGLFLPKVTVLSEESKDRKKITELMTRVGRIQLFLVGLLVVGIVVFGKEFITLWMGKDFKNSYWVAVLLILPGVIPITQNVASILMYVENKLKYTGWVYASSSAASILVSLFLIPHFGAVGSAIAICIGLTLFQLVAMNIVYHKVMKIDILYFLKGSFLKMLPSFGVILFIGVIINYFIPAPSFIIFFGKAFILGVVYLIIMWLFSLNKNEKDLFLSFVNKAGIIKFQ
ncbi:MAG: polysaccharide biosynthesis protein [Chitinophagaceae bacterium]|nr:MAG: polysaccharide biosynthesis protein [Chitinophagaceae bacterium]